MFVLGCEKGDILIYQKSTFLKRLKLHNDFTQKLTIFPNGNLLTGSVDYFLILWDMEKYQKIISIYIGDSVDGIGILTIATGDWGGYVKIWKPMVN